MRRNRRVTRKMSAAAKTSAHFGAIILVLFVMVILNLLAKSSCQQIMKTIGEDERELAKLEDERMRAATRWDEMKTPEKIEMALLRHGLVMKPPRPDQNVNMKSDGTPYPGQLSVAKSRQRAARVAQYNSSR